jgi:outer membrane lipopolysaccharide assembly protein LptE/RlpB
LRGNGECPANDGAKSRGVVHNAGEIKEVEVQKAVRLLLLAGAVLCLIALVGCGYHLVGTTSFLPPELDLLWVAQFQNTTDRADVEQRVTEAVVAELVRRGRFELVEDLEEAELHLRGTIQSVRVGPVTFDDQGRATEYQMTLTAEVKLLDSTGEKPVVVWEDRAFSRRTSYAVDATAVDYFDRQTEALDEVSRDFARALVSAMLEGF